MEPPAEPPVKKKAVFLENFGVCSIPAGGSKDFRNRTQGVVCDFYCPAACDYFAFASPFVVAGIAALLAFGLCEEIIRRSSRRTFRRS